MADTSDEKPLSRIRRKNRMLIWLLALLLLFSIGAGSYWYIAYRREAAARPERENQALLHELGQRVELPTETPEIAIVKDAAKLSNPLLASKAHNGDKLLVYRKAKRVLIYRPSTKKLVDILSIQ